MNFSFNHASVTPVSSSVSWTVDTYGGGGSGGAFLQPVIREKGTAMKRMQTIEALIVAFPAKIVALCQSHIGIPVLAGTILAG